jgi:DNA-binding NarL/FixJ family response regulator
MSGEEQVIRILIAGHQVMFRQGLRRLLESESGFVVVGEAGSGQEALERSIELVPDILLLDLEAPNSGFETLRQITSQATTVRALLLVGDQGQDQAVRALQLGARGAIRKVLSAEVLAKAIRCVHAGEYWIDRDSLATWARSSGQGQSKAKQLGLTARERQIVSEITAGATNRDIAAKFSISEQTVKRHLSNIYDKLGVFNRLELALYALANNLAAN